MKLIKPIAEYSAKQMSQNNFSIEQADYNNHKKNQDIEVSTARIILTSANGTRYALVISDAGVLSTAAA